jgi:hypothetical protein
VEDEFDVWLGRARYERRGPAAGENDALIRYHCDGLIRYHPVRLAAEDLALIERGSEAPESGVQSGVVRADQTGPRP